MRYEIRDEKEGEWDLGLQNASVRLCTAISSYDWKVQYTDTLSEGLNQRGPKVFHDLSSNYSFDVQASPLKKKNPRRNRILRLLHILLGS